MNDWSMKSTQAAPDARAIVVFGRDNSSKPHASCFDQAQAELAEKAAGLMGMHCMYPMDMKRLGQGMSALMQSVNAGALAKLRSTTLG